MEKYPQGENVCIHENKLGIVLPENISRTSLFWYTISLIAIFLLFDITGILYYIKQTALKMNNVRNKLEFGVS